MHVSSNHGPRRLAHRGWWQGSDAPAQGRVTSGGYQTGDRAAAVMDETLPCCRASLLDWACHRLGGVTPDSTVVPWVIPNLCGRKLGLHGGQAHGARRMGHACDSARGRGAACSVSRSRAASRPPVTRCSRRLPRYGRQYSRHGRNGAVRPRAAALLGLPSARRRRDQPQCASQGHPQSAWSTAHALRRAGQRRARPTKASFRARASVRRHAACHSVADIRPATRPHMAAVIRQRVGPIGGRLV